MDHERFDALTRRFGGIGTRRGLLRNLMRAGVVAIAARVGIGGGEAEARHCRDYGCSCDGGTYNACRGEMVCCPWSFNLLGGPGRCVGEDECYGVECINTGDACASYCGWGAYCDSCCSGYCGDYGVCDTPRCSGAGCACAMGTYLPCDYGLTCCPLQPGLPGGPGVCAPEGSC